MEPDGSSNFLAGGGEMGALVRSHDWAQSVLGARGRCAVPNSPAECVRDTAIVHGGRLDQGIELLSKPYTREALARKIRHVLRNQERRAAG
jgi:hypothetical protein